MKKNGHYKEILVASDLHGNVNQYKRIFEHALNNSCDAVILCGDITPKGNSIGSKEQREFLRHELFTRLAVFREETDGQIPVFLMMGNDDRKSNEAMLLKNQEWHGYTYIHNRIVPFGDYFISGYSFVPPTPFGNKDWEKLDGTETAADRGYFKMEGHISRGDEMVPGQIDGSTSIAMDLDSMFDGFSDFRRTIFVSHAPPYGTKLDMLEDTCHVGSMAIREFIVRTRPLLSLHGHIHETVGVSGDWREHLSDETPSLAVGNHHTDSFPNVILLGISKSNIEMRRMPV